MCFFDSTMLTENEAFKPLSMTQKSLNSYRAQGEQTSNTNRCVYYFSLVPNYFKFNEGVSLKK